MMVVMMVTSGCPNGVGDDGDDSCDNGGAW